jgi:hypothetical protein
MAVVLIADMGMGVSNGFVLVGMGMPERAI